MVLKMLVYARTRFTAFHQWEGAPDVYKYLSNVHRHEFHVEIGVTVTESDRQIEFHHLKMKLNAVINSLYSQCMVPGYETIKESCEVIGSRIAVEMRERFAIFPAYVDVSEDGECGGRVSYE